ncbi:MAG: NADH-quinone oxidoreductase subunit N [Thermoplasmatota archaeon]
MFDIILQGFLEDVRGALPTGEWQAMYPEIIILLFALLAPLVALGNTDRKGMQMFAAIGVGGAFFMTLASVFDYAVGPFSWQYVGASLFGGVYEVTLASQLFKTIFLGVAFLAIIGMGRVLRGDVEEDWGEFYSLILFATLGMMVVASATELMTLFIGIETASLCSYLLAAFHRDRIGGEASLKYFSFGAVASGLTLFAISLIYGAAGTTRIPELASVFVSGNEFDGLSTIAIVLLLGGLGFKISSVPFHLWSPDVYHGAPAPVAGMLATASKAMGFAAVFNIFLVGLVGVKSNWELAVALIATVTMVVGNFVAIQQTSLRRMLAYSSVAQAGYLLIALAVGTWFAVGAGILHLFVNAAMKLGAFLIVGALITYGLGDHLAGYRGLGKRAPFLAFAMAIFLFSMAGLPPFGGFTSKFILFSSAVDVGVVDQLGWLLWLAVFAVLNSAVSLVYYVRVIRTMYVEKADDDAPRLDVGSGTTFAVGVCLALVLMVGVWPQWFIDQAMLAAQAMLAP